MDRLEEAGGGLGAHSGELLPDQLLNAVGSHRLDSGFVRKWCGIELHRTDPAEGPEEVAVSRGGQEDEDFGTSGGSCGQGRRVLCGPGGHVDDE